MERDRAGTERETYSRFFEVREQQAHADELEAYPRARVGYCEKPPGRLRRRVVGRQRRDDAVDIDSESAITGGVFDKTPALLH